jgi:polysaccharide biosynthesis protein PslH
MRVLWLSHLVPYPPKAGVIQRSYHLLRQLSRAHDVDVLAFHQPALMNPIVSDPQAGLQEAVRSLNDFCNVLTVLPIPSGRSRLAKAALLFRGGCGRAGYTMEWLRSSQYEAAVRRVGKEHAYDLIHCDTISLAPYLSCVPGVPTVIDHHNIESHMMDRRAGNETNPLKRLYFSQEARKLRNAERLWCTQAALNITCADTDASRLLSVAPSANVATVPNGVDTLHFAPMPEYREGREPRPLLFVGSLNWYPNIRAVEFLIRDVWPVLKVRHPQIRLHIVGADAPARLVDMAASEPGIRFEGFLEDVRPAMSQALAFVCPIDDGGGTKLKVLNALSMSLPLIAHPVACEGIDVENERTALFARSASEFVDRIDRLWRDADLRNRLGAAGRLLVQQKYSVDGIGVALRRLYESTAADGWKRRPDRRMS